MYSRVGSAHTLEGFPAAALVFLRSLDSNRYRLAREHGFTGNELRAMARVAESGSISPKEMAASLEMTTGGITALTDGLVKSGMLTRVNDPSDRRSWIIELTPAAHEVMATIYQEFADSIDVIARKLNPQQQKEIAATLIALGQQLVATQFAT